jgi:hypothetical protein
MDAHELKLAKESVDFLLALGLFAYIRGRRFYDRRDELFGASAASTV